MSDPTGNDGWTVEELRVSIRRHGILVPLVVGPVEGSGYHVLDGSHRAQAATQLGLVAVPAVHAVWDDGIVYRTDPFPDDVAAR